VRGRHIAFRRVQGRGEFNIRATDLPGKIQPLLDSEIWVGVAPLPGVNSCNAAVSMLSLIALGLNSLCSVKMACSGVAKRSMPPAKH